ESYVVLKGDRQGTEFGGGVRVVNPYALYEDFLKAGYKYRILPPREKMWNKIMAGINKKDPYIYEID
ncbi:hypothetical protein, partial [Aggregatibacter actinomycetemcomitans]